MDLKTALGQALPRLIEPKRPMSDAEFEARYLVSEFEADWLEAHRINAMASVEVVDGARGPAKVRWVAPVDDTTRRYRTYSAR